MKIDPNHIVGNERIPTPPGVAMELLKVSQDPESTLADLAKVISADPKLTAKIISYCNSPLIGRGRETSTIQAAVFALGMRLVTTLGLSFSLMEKKNNSNLGFDYTSFWSRSLAMAVSCRVVSKTVGGNSDEDFLLGLLLNIGQIGIGSTYADEIFQMELENDSQQHDLVRQFAQKHDLDPYQVGGALLDKWNFSEAMCSFVTNFSSLDPDDSKTKIFQAGEEYASLLLSGDVSIDESRDSVNRLIGKDVKQFDEDYELIVSEYSEFAKILDFNVDSIVSVQDLELRAKELLIQTSLFMAGEIERISIEHEKLETIATTDSLTGLKNRRAYDTQVKPAIESTRRQSQPFGLAVLDIDHFGKFNNKFGHDAGDAVLRAVGQQIKSSVRDTDAVFRFGGEEFVLLLLDCNHENVCMIAERVRVAIERLEVEFDDLKLKVTASTGAVWSRADCTQSLAELFRIADQLLYVAKDQGRNQCVFEPKQRSRPPHMAFETANEKQEEKVD